MAHINLDEYKIKPNEKVSLSNFNTKPSYELSDEELEERINNNMEELSELQQKLMAEETRGIIFALQALDAAGKDEAERYLFSKLSSQSLKTSSFSKPSEEQLLHDYLWRIAPKLPKRGEIAVFNRSHYEELIGTRIHESYKDQPLPDKAVGPDMWQMRFKHFKNFEEYLADNGFYMVKIYLHISKEVQKQRLLERMEDENHNWEFSFSDLEDRAMWDEHMEIFEETFQNTSTEVAPWYAIPADQAQYGRYVISEILLDLLKELNPQYPKPSEKEAQKLEEEATKLRDGEYD